MKALYNRTVGMGVAEYFRTVAATCFSMRHQLYIPQPNRTTSVSRPRASVPVIGRVITGHVVTNKTMPVIK